MKKLLIIILCILTLVCGCSAPKLSINKHDEVSLPAGTLPPSSDNSSVEKQTSGKPEEKIPDDVLTAHDGEYTVAWISDPQHYSAKYPDIYIAMTKFLSEEKERLNLGYILHTGDLVHNPEEPEQWKNAVAAQDMISDIPNGVLAGNHDVFFLDADYGEFEKYFGADKYNDKPYYAESFENNRGHADLITLGTTDYLFLYMGYIQTPKSIRWMNEILEKYPDRYAIIVLHDYFDNDGMLSEDGIGIFEKVVSENSNVKAVLCGHRYRLCSRDSVFDDNGDGNTDRIVHEIMGNYQAAGDIGGSGFMRFFKINEEKNKVYMYSYSPYLNEYVYFDTPERQSEKYAADPSLETAEFDLTFLC